MPALADPTLPYPVLDIAVQLPADLGSTIDEHLRRIPAKAGVYLLQDENAGTLALASTSNLRKTITSRLESPPAASSTGRVNYRAIARMVFATEVASAFEADWAYLQLARLHLPRTYQSVLDQWQAWFVAIDPTAPFPRFVKTAHPGRQPAGADFACFGPFADKHAAARYMDALQDIFDLCRYHHILVQAPHGTACAYKEMGRCPAPCDGTVSMKHYHEQLHQAMRFAGMPVDLWRSETEHAMNRAAASLDFETARKMREQLDRSKAAAKPSFSHVRPLNSFQFIAVARSPRKKWVRLLEIRCGWIHPLCDCRIDATASDLDTIIRDLKVHSQNPPTVWDDASIENVGLVCWHLFRPRSKNPTCEMLRLDDDLTVRALARSMKRIARSETDQEETPENIGEHEWESEPAGG